jgi:hypothetical protein
MSTNANLFRQIKLFLSPGSDKPLAISVLSQKKPIKLAFITKERDI